MKSISVAAFLFLLLLLLHLATAEFPAVSSLDQRNRPPNVRINARSPTRKQHLNNPNQNFDYNYLSEYIYCQVTGNSPFSNDVFKAIASLSANKLRTLRCVYDNTPGDGENQFCNTLAFDGSAAISICTTLTKRVDCKKIAAIVAAIRAKCEEEYHSESRIGGRVRMAWGNIYVFNSTMQLRVGE